MSSDSQDKQKSEEKPDKPLPIKKCADLQRLKLDKLMKNFDKPIVIPERPKEKSITHVPEFIRNVMGSSAGAGSGEFHVYRHLRRKEYARQKFIQLKSEKEMLDEAYKRKLEENARIAEERTAKKRAKRQKKKEKMKNRKKRPKVENDKKEESEKSETDDDDDEEMEKNEEVEEKNEETEGKNEQTEEKNEQTEGKNEDTKEKNEQTEEKNEQTECKNEETEDKAI